MFWPTLSIDFIQSLFLLLRTGGDNANSFSDAKCHFFIEISPKCPRTTPIQFVNRSTPRFFHQLSGRRSFVFRAKLIGKCDRKNQWPYPISRPRSKFSKTKNAPFHKYFHKYFIHFIRISELCACQICIKKLKYKWSYNTKKRYFRIWRNVLTKVCLYNVQRARYNVQRTTYTTYKITVYQKVFHEFLDTWKV